MIKKISIILFLFLLSSCIITNQVPNLISENYLVEQRFPENKKAIIIIGGVESVSDTSSSWYKIDKVSGGSYDKHIGINRFNEQQIIMLEPGIYSLKSFQTKYTSKEISWIEIKNGLLYDIKTKEPALASFTAEAGEVVYLGEVKFSSYNIGEKGFWSNQQDAIVRINVSNNIEAAKQKFYSKYPKLKNYKIITRLIQVNEKNK